MFNLEKSIQEWLKQFHKHRAYDQGSIQEMELHLRDHIDDLKSQGFSDQQAFKEAVKAFGEVSPIAKEEFVNQKRNTSIRSILFTTMLNNYFKTSLRSMMKNPMSSFINVFGLAMAIGACMVTYAFMDFDYRIDRFHENKDELYLTTFYVNREGTEEQYGTTPRPLGALLKEDFSNIEKICRIEDGPVVIKYQDQVFHEQVRYVDSEFLEMFTFPLKWGVANSLKDVNSIILSEEMAIKYFGDGNPIGQEVKLILGEGKSKLFKVSGVAQPFPKARIIDFDFLVNIKNRKILNPAYDFNDWRELINATFIQVKNPSNLPLIKKEMDKYKQFQHEVEPDWAISSFNFVSLHDLHLASAEIRNDISYDATDEGRIGLPFIASFFLILACFNYINIAIVSAAKRLKEIGLRKVIGANRKVLIFQFLSENLLLTFFAGILGFILAITIILPWFSTFSGITSQFNLLDGNLWLFLFTILLITGIISGIYPAFYISKFQVVQIFKGTVKFGKKNTLTKIFLTIQLIIACVGIAFAVMFAQNSWYQAKRSWGYDQKGALYLQLTDASDFKKLETELKKEPGVMSISGSKHHLSKSYVNTILHLPDHQYEVQELTVDANYLETMGLKLAKGRFFQENHKSDYQSLVVNELFVKNLELKEPIGRIVKIEERKYEIVGVVKNFHFNNFYYENRPVIFTLSHPEDYQFLTLKTEAGKQMKTYEVLQTTWGELFPETPFHGGLQEDTWIGFYEDLGTMQRFTRAVAFVFVLMAVLGLYGLIQLNITGRIREFSIRKTLGANIKNLAKSVVSQYIVIFSIAVILGIPFGHILNTALLDMMFPDPRPFGYSGSIVSSIILVFVLSSVVATQVRKVSKANPVEGLKVES